MLATGDGNMRAASRERWRDAADKREAGRRRWRNTKIASWKMRRRRRASEAVFAVGECAPREDSKYRGAPGL